ADVLEVDVDAVRGRRVELGAPVIGPVIDAGVVAELLHRVGALLRPAGDADHPACATLPGDLPGDRPDRAAGGGDDDRVALPHRGQIVADVGGDAGMAERPE